METDDYSLFINLTVVLDSIRDAYYSKAKDNSVKNAINQLYRKGSIIGDGGTAAVIEFEKSTGILLSNKGYKQKGRDMLAYLKKIRESHHLNSNDDKMLVDKMIIDLESALGEK